MLAAGKSVGEVLKPLEVSEATLSRWLDASRGPDRRMCSCRSADLFISRDDLTIVAPCRQHTVDMYTVEMNG